MTGPISREHFASNPEGELPKTKTYVLQRFVNASPTQLSRTISGGNAFQSSWGDSSLPGVFFSAVLAKSPEQLEIEAENRRLLKPKFMLKYVDMGGGVGVDVSYDKEEAKAYLNHGPYAARILIHITPDNFHVFRGRIYLSERIDVRDRQFTLVDSFDSLKDHEVTVNLDGLSVRQLKKLGEHVKIAIFSEDNLDPNYVSYADFIKKQR